LFFYCQLKIFCNLAIQNLIINLKFNKMKNRKFSTASREMKMTPFLIDLQKQKANKKTIFYNNKSFKSVLFEGVLFATGTATALTIVASLIIAITHI